MGNAQSQKKDSKDPDLFFNEELINSIDELASKLIFEQSFQNLLKLNDPTYCDEVSVLTHRLLKKKLKPINVNVVSTRVKYGNQDLYAITDEGFKHLKVVDEAGEKNYDKNEMCLNVSKFYTRIFQAYSAIVSAINPVYIYKDVTGEEKIKSVFDNVSGENKKRANIGLRSLCSRRIFYLKPKKMGEKEMTIKVNTCKMNVKGRDIPYLTREHVEHREPPKEEREKKEEVVKGEEVDEKKEVVEGEDVVEETGKEGEDVVEETGKEGEDVVKEGEKKEVVEQQGGESDEKKEGEEEVKKEGEEEVKKEKEEMVEGEADKDVVVEDEKEKEEIVEDEAVKKQEDRVEKEGEVKMVSDIIDTMTLADEPGIVSLENLYKDVMKIKTDDGKLKGEFVMSDKSKSKYKNDLKDFYKAFVPKGNDIGSIEKFSDIKLTDFTKSKECLNKDVAIPWGKTIKGDARKKEDSLFVEYGKHFQTMISHVKDREGELVDLLHELFSFDLEKDVPIKIKGDLTEDKLNKEIMPKIMKTIKTMYIDCEKDFQRGIEIYGKIYKQRNNL